MFLIFSANFVEAFRADKIMLLIMFYLLQEGLNHTATAESFISAAVQWLRLVVESIGAIIVAVGIGLAVFQLLKILFFGRTEDYNQVRLTLARYLALALEFQLGADILSTAVAPSWEQIGKLGAIAIIRTGLNYFLMREMALEKSKTTDFENKNEFNKNNESAPV